jgi:hypothetical protein
MLSIENPEFLSQYLCSDYATGTPYVCVSTATIKTIRQGKMTIRLAMQYAYDALSVP